MAAKKYLKLNTCVRCGESCQGRNKTCDRCKDWRALRAYYMKKLKNDEKLTQWQIEYYELQRKTYQELERDIRRLKLQLRKLTDGTAKPCSACDGVLVPLNSQDIKICHNCNVTVDNKLKPGQESLL